jgi:hypothetical protein
MLKAEEKSLTFFGEKRRSVANRVARWYIFRPKNPIWENFGGPLNGKYWYILWSF